MGFHTRSRHFLNRSLVHFDNSEIQKRHMTHTNPQSVGRVWARLGFPAHPFWPSQSSRVFGGELTGRSCAPRHSFTTTATTCSCWPFSYSSILIQIYNSFQQTPYSANSKRTTKKHFGLLLNDEKGSLAKSSSSGTGG